MFQEKTRGVLIRISAGALAAAGLLWCIKAGTIIVTGSQPPLTFEVGQIFFSAGIMGIYATFDRPHRLEKTGLVVAVLSLIGAVLGLLYPLVPGAQISTSEEFVVPYSLFVLLGSVGGFVAFLLMGVAVLRSGTRWNRWHTVPLIVALVPLPLIATGLIHIEMPILFIGVAWVVLAWGLWRVSTIRASSHEGRVIS